MAFLREWAFSQEAKIPCSAVPNCPAPAITPHGYPHRHIESRQAVLLCQASDDSFVAPYSDTGAPELNDSPRPATAYSPEALACVESKSEGVSRLCSSGIASQLPACEYTRLELRKIKTCAMTPRQYSST